MFARTMIIVSGEGWMPDFFNPVFRNLVFSQTVSAAIKTLLPSRDTAPIVRGGARSALMPMAQ
jgi:hypothetical protein